MYSKKDNATTKSCHNHNNEDDFHSTTRIWTAYFILCDGFAMKWFSSDEKFTSPHREFFPKKSRNILSKWSHFQKHYLFRFYSELKTFTSPKKHFFEFNVLPTFPLLNKILFVDPCSHYVFVYLLCTLFDSQLLWLMLVSGGVPQFYLINEYIQLHKLDID